MEKFEEGLKNLKTVVNGGREFWEKSGNLPLEYVTLEAVPALQDVLKDLCLRIKEHHKVDEPTSDEDNFVIHYTSIAALVSMLQDASQEPEYEDEDKEKERENKDPESDPTSGDKKSLWRLYDSVHLNDPEEGSLLIRNLSKKYDWLGKRETSHAYIASFILPNTKEDLSNNLVFWRTYGKEGEGCSLSLCIPRSRLQKIHYGTRAVQSTVRMLSPVLDSLAPLIRIRKSSIREPIQKVLLKAVWDFLETIRYLYKNKAYDYENECRFVVAELSIRDKHKIRFEDKNLNNSPIHIRHYYEHEDLKIKKLLATGSSTTLGPRVPHANNICYFLNTLRKRAGLDRQEIKISDIPYRKY